MCLLDYIETLKVRKQCTPRRKRRRSSSTKVVGKKPCLLQAQKAASWMKEVGLEKFLLLVLAGGELHQSSLSPNSLKVCVYPTFVYFFMFRIGFASVKKVRLSWVCIHDHLCSPPCRDSKL